MRTKSRARPARRTVSWVRAAWPACWSITESVAAPIPASILLGAPAASRGRARPSQSEFHEEYFPSRRSATSTDLNCQIAGWAGLLLVGALAFTETKKDFGCFYPQSTFSLKKKRKLRDPSSWGGQCIAALSGWIIICSKCIGTKYLAKTTAKKLQLCFEIVKTYLA